MKPEQRATAFRLAEQLPRKVAMELMFTGEPMSAADALKWGLINQVVPAAELDAAVDTMTAKLLDRMPSIMRYAKQQTNFWRDLAWHETINHARDWLALSMATDEPKEAIRKFLEKK